jgi:hypothetical protein
MAADKPTINLSLSALEAEIVKPEPFVLALKDGKRVTFPDIFDRPADEAAEFLSDLRSSDDFDLMAKWLSEDDFKRYKAAKIPLRSHAAIMQAVMSYYEQTMGTPGEGRASAS